MRLLARQRPIEQDINACRDIAAFSIPGLLPPGGQDRSRGGGEMVAVQGKGCDQERTGMAGLGYGSDLLLSPTSRLFFMDGLREPRAGNTCAAS